MRRAAKMPRIGQLRRGPAEQRQILAAAIDMDTQRMQRRFGNDEPGLLQQFASRRRSKALARLGHAFRDVLTRRPGRTPEQQTPPASDDDPAAGRLRGHYRLTTR